MIIRTAWLVTILALLTSFCSAADINVELTVDTRLESGPRVVVVGKTNLPPGTELMVSLDDALTEEIRGQTKTTVMEDGTFESQSLGPVTGVKDGRYVASVTAPYSRTQPEGVRKITGELGERLVGPLVKRDETFGVSVNVEHAFTVGGEDADDRQSEQLQDDVARLERMRKDVADMYKRLERTKKLGLLDDDDDLENLGKWGVFARPFSAEVQAMQETIDAEVTSLQHRVHIFDPLNAVLMMFNAAAFQKDSKYAEGKSDYEKAMKELDQYLAELKGKLPKAPESAAAKFRTWTTKGGKHSVSARLVSVDGTNVVLERRDGKQVTVPLSKLSSADRAFIDSSTRSASSLR